MGWWKFIKDWYVRFTKKKYVQAPKKYTDREVLQFYQTQLPSIKSEPMKNFALTLSHGSTTRISDSEADSNQPASQLEENDMETVERESADGGSPDVQPDFHDNFKEKEKESTRSRISGRA